MTTKTIWLPFLLLTAACATPQFPSRPQVSFYNNPAPMFVEDESTVKMIGTRRLVKKMPVPICLTDADHLKLETYFDAVDAWVNLYGR